jgi:hypothetical protein
MYFNTPQFCCHSCYADHGQICIQSEVVKIRKTLAALVSTKNIILCPLTMKAKMTFKTRISNTSVDDLKAPVTYETMLTLQTMGSGLRVLCTIFDWVGRHQVLARVQPHSFIRSLNVNGGMFT